MTQSVPKSRTIKSPRTPVKPDFRLLEPGAISPTAIEELSAQIESLIQRGRHLRELKNSMSRSSSIKTMGETRTSVFDPSGRSPILTPVQPMMSETIAYLDASDPLYTENPREPRIPAQMSDYGSDEIHGLPEPSNANTKLVLPSVSPVRSAKLVISAPINGTSSDMLVCSILALECEGLNPTGLCVRLRTSEGSGDRVMCRSQSEVSVEVWDKRTTELLAMGRTTLPSPPIDSVKVQCFEVWDGHPLATVTLRIEVNPPTAPTVLESSVDSGRTSVQMNYTYKESLDEFLLKRSVHSAKPPVPQFSPMKSVESFVSFLSNHEKELDDMVLSDDDDIIPSKPIPTRVAPLTEPPTTSRRPSQSESKTQRLVDSFVQSLPSASLEDPRSMLMQNMRELEEITNRLTGKTTVPDSVEVEPVMSDESPIERNEFAQFVPPPDFTMLFKQPVMHTRSVSRPRRRKTSRARGIRARGRRNICSKEDEGPLELSASLDTNEASVGLQRHCGSRSHSVSNIVPIATPEEPSVEVSQIPHSSLSVMSGVSRIVIRAPELVTTEPVVFTARKDPPLSLERQRKQSIERSRRDISTLRESLLKNADRITSVLRSTGQDDAVLFNS